MKLLDHEPQPLAASRKRWWVIALLALPLLATVCFIAKYATAFPLTDEWAFVRSVANLGDIDWSKPGAFDLAVDAATLRFNGHIVAVPFLLYWLLAPLTHFDNRFFACFTLAIFAVQVLLYRRWFGRWTLALLPIALVMCSTSHYMEFLWGFEFTLALSVVLPLAGLSVVASIASTESPARQLGKLALGLLLALLGALSSLGGVFGFACIPLLIVLGPLERRAKLRLAVAATLAGGLAGFTLLRGVQSRGAFGARELFDLLTALGGTIWGTPVGLSEFGLDFRSATGALILASLLACLAVAVRARCLAKIALPLSFAAFGLLCVTSIAAGREYLGNWHLQYALPAVCGTYACAYGVWREVPRSRAALAPFALSTAILLCCVEGSRRGFVEYGPSYRAYVGEIESYAKRSLLQPDLPHPFPSAPVLDADLLLYLAARGHALFASARPPRDGRETSDARVFVREVELPLPRKIKGPNTARLRWTVVLGPATRARGVLLDVGGARLELHRVHPAWTHISGVGDAACFMGELLPGRASAGPNPVRVLLVD